MREKLKISLTLFLIICASIGHDAFPQEAQHLDESSLHEADSTWAQSIKPFVALDTESQGWRWLLTRASSSRYVLFGEQHGIREIPMVVERLLKEIEAEGFRHLVLEASPWLGHRINREGASTVLTANPFELAFNDDAMVQLITSAAERGIDVWGVDQPVTAVHGFDKLGSILPGILAPRIARGLYLKAALQQGQYIRSDNHKDLNALWSAIGGQEITQEAHLLLDSIELSMQIYLAYFAGQRGEPVVEKSSSIRERFMIENFMKMYRAHQEIDTKPVKAVFLLGGAHIVKGIGPNRVPTLGDFVEEFAGSHGDTALHVAIRSRVDDAPAALPPAVFDNSQSVLVDTESLLAYADPVWLSGLSRELRRDLEGYDAIIILGDATRDSRTLLNEAMSEAKTRFVKQLATMAVPAALLLFFLTAYAMRKGIRKCPCPAPQWPLIFIMGLLIAMLALLVFQFLAIQVAGVARVSVWQSIVSGSILLLLAVGAVATGVLSLTKRWWNMKTRSLYVFCAATAALLAVQMAFWNIGGMLL